MYHQELTPTQQKYHQARIERGKRLNAAVKALDQRLNPPLPPPPPKPAYVQNPKWDFVITPKTALVKKIQRLICLSFNVELDDLISEQRTRNVVLPRQIAMYLCRKLTQHSFPEIGRRFGGRDHTTVLHSVSKIEHLRSRIPLIAEVITRITETMKDDEHGQQHLE